MVNSLIFNTILNTVCSNKVRFLFRNDLGNNLKNNILFYNRLQHTTYIKGKNNYFN